MPTYLHPGVYIEEIPSGAKPIEGVSTSTAAFIGFAAKGPVGEAELITKWDDYYQQYGGIREVPNSLQGDAMGFSVSAFFQNGGRKAYVVRLAADDSPDDPLEAAVGYVLHPDESQVLEFTAVNEGEWANGLVVRLTVKPSDASLYTLQIGRLDSRGELGVLESFADVSLDSTSARYIESAVNDISSYVTVEIASPPSTYPASYVANFLGTSTSGDLSGADLDLSAALVADRRFDLALDGDSAFTVTVGQAAYTLASLATEIQAQVNAGAGESRTAFTAVASGDTLVLTSGTRTVDSSTVVTDGGNNLAATLSLGLTNGGVEAIGLDSLRDEGDLVDGGDGVPAGSTEYQDVFTAFLKIRDISIICLPDMQWGDTQGQAIIEQAISHAERMKSRMVIVDPPATELEDESDVAALTLPTSTYTALYYPWVKVANPFYDEDDNPGVPTTLLVPPSGYAAGMWSKIDGRRGVWKAPAGVETQLLGVSALAAVVEDPEQDFLNPLGVNAFRKQPSFGHVIWGARTLSTKAAPEWRYVPVRRTAIFIEQSIYNGIQWAVFEGNDHRLWASLRLNIESFMDGLHRSGAFQGQKASDAYFVRCGLGDTMTQGDIDRGQVIVIVGFAPLKPAEFVIVRIQQKVAQQ
ncbi:MAG: phage tail sheath subtilisin-like domain-containing protein [Acidobacteriota bacterium]|nr:phage tail sheath subtilisin-like domain-containing protein [Acidobacteriota bacterium]MDH3523201.1 phage tail sheath subtilisin-like domain-containing protein [Acidobacteriota bacterium]